MERNIYKIGKELFITNDEEIKEGDYVYSTSQDYNIQKVLKQFVKGYNDAEHYKKIILTIDQDLIKDGVQAIDDEFLEWFVKNPSCEEVEVELEIIKRRDTTLFVPPLRRYKIIIPKEKPKQVWKQIIETCGGKEEFMKSAELLPKQETLKEGFDRIYNSIDFSEFDFSSFIIGAKWQQEQILEFLYLEITERRDYSASKMCEVVIEFIEQLNTKK
jgi:hypothetical protein